MKKRPRIASKTKEKLKWLKENKDKYEYEDDFKESFISRFNLSKRQSNRVLDIFFGKMKNFSERRGRLVSKEKKFIGKEEECYFCRSKKYLINHHLSYIPEKEVILCRSCHSKLHNILEKNHQDNLDTGDKFLLLKEKLQEMNEILGVKK